MTFIQSCTTIGVTVYNGEAFIQMLLELMLIQTTQNLEFIILDNGSTDKTAEICQAYAAKDERIRFYRNSTRMGDVWNQNCILDLAIEGYKFITVREVNMPDFIEEFAETLESISGDCNFGDDGSNRVVPIYRSSENFSVWQEPEEWLLHHLTN